MAAPKYKFNNEQDKFLSEKEYIDKYYRITKDGHIFRRDLDKELKPTVGHKGYLQIRLKLPLLSKNTDGRKAYRINRLVAMFFIPNYSAALEVNHINGIKDDNRIENLEMVTSSENAYHAWNVLNSENRRKKLSLRQQNKGRPIKQYSLDGEYLATYETARLAAKKYNVHAASIHTACITGYSCQGYYFTFADICQPTKDKLQNRRHNPPKWKILYNGRIYTLREFSRFIGKDRKGLIDKILAGKILGATLMSNDEYERVR